MSDPVEQDDGRDGVERRVDKNTYNLASDSREPNLARGEKDQKDEERDTEDGPYRPDYEGCETSLGGLLIVNEAGRRGTDFVAHSWNRTPIDVAAE
jgi:hypothetical protein